MQPAYSFFFLKRYRFLPNCAQLHFHSEKNCVWAHRLRRLFHIIAKLWQLPSGILSECKWKRLVFVSVSLLNKSLTQDTLGIFKEIYLKNGLLDKIRKKNTFWPIKVFISQQNFHSASDICKSPSSNINRYGIYSHLSTEDNDIPLKKFHEKLTAKDWNEEGQLKDSRLISIPMECRF